MLVKVITLSVAQLYLVQLRLVIVNSVMSYTVHNPLQYQRFEENLTATVLRDLELANFVDSVSQMALHI